MRPHKNSSGLEMTPSSREDSSITLRIPLDDKSRDAVMEVLRNTGVDALSIVVTADEALITAKSHEISDLIFKMEKAKAVMLRLQRSRTSETLRSTPPQMRSTVPPMAS